MLSTTLGRRGYSIPKSQLSAKDQEGVRRDLMFRQRAGPAAYGLPPEFPVYLESNTKMYVPRCYGWKRFGPPATRALSEGEPIALAFDGSLRADQLAPARKYLSAAKATGAGLLDLYCGFGKTVVALWLVAELGRKTIIIVHKDFLVTQWRERIEQFLPGASVGRIQGQVVDVEGHDVVIAMLQSLALKDYPRDMCDRFGFAIVDECHHMSAETFSSALFKVVTPRMLGLSATMTRKDGLSKVFKLFLGEVVARKRREEREVVVRIERYATTDSEFLHVPTDHRGQVAYSKLLSKVHADPGRAAFVLDLLSRVIAEEHGASPPRQILLLAQHRCLVAWLMHEITARQLATVGYYLGGMKSKALKEAEGCKVILGTYEMAKEALDIKTLTTLILATPMADVAQAVGRIMRVPGHVPVVYDVVDPHSTFRRQAKKRLTYYKKEKYTIVDGDAPPPPEDEACLPGECLV